MTHMREQEFLAAAWAPHMDFAAIEAGTSDVDVERDWHLRRAGLAAAWVRSRAADEGVGLVLRVPAHAHSYSDPRHALATFAREAVVATNKSHPCGVRGANLVHEGHPAEIERGMLGADGSSILVTEDPGFPIEGWAMTLGALNLRSMRPTPDTRTAEQVELLDRLVGNLYGGWSHPSGKRAASHYLSALADSGMTQVVFVGSLLATAPERYDAQAIAKHSPPVWLMEAEARLRRYTWPE